MYTITSIELHKTLMKMKTEKKAAILFLHLVVLFAVSVTNGELTAVEILVSSTNGVSCGVFVHI